MHNYDYIVIGSGFGGSVSALRLSEKGYSVLVLEQGRHKRPEDLPKSNWNLRKWLWAPVLGFFGLFKVTFFRHVSVLSGTGVGGGSLVYANTLPVPEAAFFKSGSWAQLADWQKKLKPHYNTALKMLGAQANPTLFAPDLALKKMSVEMGLGDKFGPTNVAVFFGKDGQEGKTVKDPYFKGKGPDRAGCIFCGACMTGCRHNAKNTLDKNYLFLAQKLGATIKAEARVVDVLLLDENDAKSGYQVIYRKTGNRFKSAEKVTCGGVVFSAGVLGTIKLLLNLKSKSLPRLSPMLGRSIRTNNESLLAVISPSQKENFSQGVAIGSIVHTDDNSHLEPVRYASGSGFWRLVFWPAAVGNNILVRIFRTILALLKNPWQHLKILFIRDWAKSTQILLFMQTLDSTLSFTRGLFGLKSKIDTGGSPTPFIPEAHAVAKAFAKQVKGQVYQPNSESLFGIPTTAHILGGACMGRNADEGVIDANNKVFGYENMYVCDGSMISANPGVNPSLSITAISEHAMSKIKPQKSTITTKINGKTRSKKTKAKKKPPAKSK